MLTPRPRELSTFVDSGKKRYKIGCRIAAGGPSDAEGSGTTAHLFSVLFDPFLPHHFPAYDVRFTSHHIVPCSDKMARQQLHGHLVRKSTSCCAASVCSAALLLPRSEVAVTMLHFSVLPADKIESSSEDDGLLCSIIRVGVEASAAALACVRYGTLLPQLRRHRSVLCCPSCRRRLSADRC